MKDIDRKIREALRAEDQELFEEVGEEQSIFEMTFDLFRGRNRWLLGLSMTFILVFFVLAVICAVQFFRADALEIKLAWGVGFLYASLAVAMLKIWWWMEMHRNSVIREIKRVELQIARLARRVEK